MEGEFLDKQDVINFPIHVKRPDVAQWELSLRRLSRAQALLWHETPINERLKILDRIDKESEKQS